MRYYVTTDIHGFYTPFEKELRKSGYFQDEGPKKLIVCGDLFDRGEEAEKVQRFVVKNREDLILTAGSCSWMILDFPLWPCTGSIG